ncbi:MAG: sigma-54-dependent Fis family transcriptional regulator [Deltaproteobacteria bacterium]|nr:sigma-54-dependent Fis family transcriptional regulator [Deltaproteobacteria bacterium]
MGKRIVIVDDDPTMRAALHETLSVAGYETVQCPDGGAAEQVIQAGGVDLVISDVRMPGMDGLELLRRTQAGAFPPPFIVISGHATVPEAVEAMKRGAYDLLVKPFSYRELTGLVEAALRREEAAGGLAEDTEEESTGDIVTSHPRMRTLLKFATEVAKSQASVLIQGESGTGKELLARFIHARSRRRNGPFVAVNCAALPEGLLESELFGHERGAFTGALVSKPGKFELAHTGTVLLDEVSEMPLLLQAKLLRTLQEREVDRVGGRKPLRIDIRVVATTNRDLRQMISAGTFREDLFYRLNVIPLRLPPLRERIEDLEPIARAFLSRAGYRKAVLSPQAVSVLKAHPWPGNIRELGNVLERAAIVAGGGVIEPEHLLLEEESLSPGSAVRDPEPRMQNAECRMQNAEFLAPNSQPLTPSSQPDEYIRAGISVQEMEERLIQKTLSEVHDNRTQAAKLLGISVRTLRNKLKQYQKPAVSCQ